jgi:hypothetical protein
MESKQCGGGDPYRLDDDADIIIADMESQKALTRQYQEDRRKHVETILWIQECINDNEYKRPEPFIKNLGGRKAGATYVSTFPRFPCGRVDSAHAVETSIWLTRILY